MRDINFDELDKAVSSVLQKDGVNTGSSLGGSDELDSDDMSRKNTRGSSSDTPAIVPQRRRGQFMDIVHPSSDMSSLRSAKSEPGVPPMRRSQPAIKPLSADVVEGDRQEVEEPDSMPPVDRSELIGESDDRDLQPYNNENRDAETRAAELVGVENSFEVDAISHDDEANQEPVAGPLHKEPVDSFDIRDEQPKDIHNEAAVSPFVESSDVEKRPLGAFSTGSDTPSQSDSSLETEQDTPEAQDMPVELHPDVVSVEADTDSNDIEESQTVSSLSPSIPQQYSVAKTSDDESDDEHAVFDTSQYHKPLDPPAKPKSHKLFYIIMAILMVLVGSAVGYLVWVLKLL